MKQYFQASVFGGERSLRVAGTFFTPRKDFNPNRNELKVNR